MSFLQYAREVPVYSEEDCTCSNRHFEQASQAPVIAMAMAAPSADGNCVLDTCSSGYFKSSWPGDCFPCNEKNSYEVASESDCTGSCNNRKFIPGSSISVSYSATSAPANEWGYCALKNCPSGYAATDDYGNCTRISPDAFNNNSSGCTGAGYRYCTANNTCVASNCCENVDTTACQECISSSGEIVTFNSGDYCYENDESGKCDNNANCMTPSSYNGNSSGCTNAGYHYCSISNKCVATDGACCSVSNSTCYQCDSSTGAVTKPGSETSCNYNNQGANSGECNGNGSCVQKKTYSLVSGAYSRTYCTTGSGPGGSPKCSTTASLSTIGLSGSESAATVISKLQSLTYTGTAYSNQNVYLTDARINSDGSITMSPGSGTSGSCLCVN